MINTALTALLGIRHPIVLGGMSGGSAAAGEPRAPEDGCGRRR